LVEQIQPVLEEKLDGTPEDLREVALYLADEYLQGGDGILVVSQTTGLALARLAEEDVWQPKPVRREDGTLVQPLPRLRPDLEGFLVQWVFDRSREEQHVSTLAPWVASTPAAQQMTYAGRQGLTKRIEDSAPNILKGLGGRACDFLDRFQVLDSAENPYSGLETLPRATAFARTRTPLADLKSFNVRFDPFSMQMGVIGTTWVMEMARFLGASHPNPEPKNVEDIHDEDTLGRFWVVDASAKKPFYRRQCYYGDFPVALGLPHEAGVLQIHSDSYRVVSREVFDRWEVAAAVDFTFHVDWDKIRGLRIEVPATTHVVF
jgi:hypothetical protein